jgi:hypothetical protein
MSTRLDLFGTVHKGLRAGMFGVTQQAAGCDFGVKAEAIEMAAAVGRLLGFLHEHADHEEREVLPEIARCCPELAADLRSDHVRVDGLERELERIAERMAGADAPTRVSLGRRLQERLWILVAEHLRHMEREEIQANRLLWANLGDEELAAVEARIVGSIAPPRLAEWMALILPAASAPERALLLAKTGAAS